MSNDVTFSPQFCVKNMNIIYISLYLSIFQFFLSIYSYGAKRATSPSLANFCPRLTPFLAICHFCPSFGKLHICPFLTICPVHILYMINQSLY